MIKIPCLFEREFPKKSRPVLLRTVTPGCEWALTEVGTPTQKRDGTACLVKDGKLYKRFDVRLARGATVPVGAIPCIPEADPVTGHWPHWVEVGGEPESKWHREAWTGLRAADGSRFRPAAQLEVGTYEAVRPAHRREPRASRGARLLPARQRDLGGLALRGARWRAHLGRHPGVSRARPHRGDRLPSQDRRPHVQDPP